MQIEYKNHPGQEHQWQKPALVPFAMWEYCTLCNRTRPTDGENPIDNETKNTTGADQASLASGQQ